MNDPVRTTAASGSQRYKHLGIVYFVDSCVDSRYVDSFRLLLLTLLIPVYSAIDQKWMIVIYR